MDKIRINGSICLSDISAKFKEGHSAFSTAANGKIYMNFTGWVNSANDDFKDFSLQLNSKQDKQEAEGKVYVGNGKIKPQAAAQTTQEEPKKWNTPTPTAKAAVEVEDDTTLPF